MFYLTENRIRPAIIFNNCLLISNMIQADYQTTKRATFLSPFWLLQTVKKTGVI